MRGSFVIVIIYTGALLLHDELPLEEIRPIIHSTGGVWDVVVFKVKQI